MKRSTHILFLFFTLLLPYCTYGFNKSGGGGRLKDKLDQMRRKTYVREMELTDEEANKFWPVFQKMQAETEAVTLQLRKVRGALSADTMTQSAMEELLTKMLDLEQKKLDIRRRYIEEFKKVIPVSKIVLMPKAEREFKKLLLQKVAERRADRQKIKDTLDDLDTGNEDAASPDKKDDNSQDNKIKPAPKKKPGAKKKAVQE